MKHLQIVLLLVILSNGPHTQGAQRPLRAESEIGTKPNIVLILADDLGYGDLQCFGATDMQTPHIDSLMSRGMRFDHFHSFLGDMMDDYWTHLRGGETWMRLNENEIAPTGHATDLFSQWSNSDYSMVTVVGCGPVGWISKSVFESASQ